MNKDDVIIERFIRKLRRHLTVQSVTDAAVPGGTAGFVIAIIISVLSMFIPFYYAGVCSVCAVFVGVAAGAVYGFVKRPSMEKSALRADSLGYKERLVTAYGLAGEEGVFVDAVRREAVAVTEKVNPGRDMPHRVRWGQMAVFALLACVFAATTFVDTDARRRADTMHEADKQADELDKEIEELSDRLEEVSDGLSDEEISELSELLSDIREELDETDEPGEVRDIADRSYLKLSDVSKSLDGKNADAAEAFKKTADRLRTAENTAGMTENKTAENTDRQQTEGSQSDGNQTGSNQSGSQSDGQQTGSNQSGSQTGSNQTGDNQTGSNQSGSNQTGSNQTGNQTGSNQSGSNQTGNQTGSNQSGNQTGSNQTGGNQSGGQQSGGQQSGGQQSGGGQSGGQQTGGQQSGNGTDTGMGGGWYSGSDSSSERDSARLEEVTIPDGEIGDDDNLTGVNNGNGSQTYEKSDGSLTWSGNRVSYGDVSGSYREQAYQQIDSADYPSEMKDKIKQYFDGFN